MSNSRSLGLNRFDVLGWQGFLDAGSLARLCRTSPEFQSTGASWLINALREHVKKSSCHSSGQIVQEIQALARLAARGDAATIAALVPCLVDLPAVRQAAVCALRLVSARGDERVLQQIEVLLKEGQEPVAILHSLSQLAARGDPAAVTQVVTCLAHDSLEVRMAATDAISKLAKGDAFAITEVADLLQNGRESARQAAKIALQRIAEPGDARAVAALVKGLGATSIEARRVVVQTLEWMLPRECSADRDAAVAALVQLLESDEAPKVRATAAEALGKISLSTETTLWALSASLLDEESSVRKGAVQALGQLATLGEDNACSVAVFVDMVRDPSSEVQTVATLALGRLAQDKDSEAVPAIIGRMREGTDIVRLAAATAAGQLIQRGNSAMIAAALEAAQVPSGPTREAADFALQLLPDNLKWVHTKKWAAESPKRGCKTPEPLEGAVAFRRGHRKLVM